MFVLFGLAGCGRDSHVDPAVATSSQSRIASLRALARLYGVVRWFHPSDAAAAIDWDRFAIDAAHRVVDAQSPDDLRAALTLLFGPIAPTMQIVGAGEQFSHEPVLHPQESSGLEVISWQHRGYGDSIINSGYASKRRHRARSVPVPGAAFAILSQSIDATPYRGTRIRLRGKVRTARHARGNLWLRVNRGNAMGFFDNMENRPIMTTAWSEAVIVGTVDADATKIIFGPLVAEAGTVWFDDLELSVEANDGTWRTIPINDGGFEVTDPLESWRSGSASSKPIEGWRIVLDRSRPASGASSLQVEPVTQVTTDELFDAAPTPGEIMDVDLGSGLRARVPLALYSKNHQTLGDSPEAARLSQAPPSVEPRGFDTVSGAADVIVTWNVFSHFWVYWNVVSVDWMAELDHALADALDDRNVDAHLTTLRRLAAAAPDAHVAANCPGESEVAYLPVGVDLVEGQIVVSVSGDDMIRRGDIVASVDGRPSAALLAAAESLVSGSPQWRRVRALEHFGLGGRGSAATLELQRGGVDLRLTVSRIDRKTTVQVTRPAVEQLGDGVYYVDLQRARMEDLNAAMAQLAKAPGIVFDLRGPPNINHEVISHIVTHVDTAGSWEAIPLVIRPYSGSTPSSWEDTSSNMPELKVLEPHISGRIAFLTGPHAMSYAESIMSYVEHYRLGAIVGAATAGTNGDMAQLGTPTGCTMFFTGRRFTHHDGSRFHLIGVRPTIPVSPTIAGVASGRDEVLERGLTYVRTAR